MKKKIYIFILVIATWAPSSSPASELLTIVYSNLGQLCSTTPDGATNFCISSEKEYRSPSWQPNGDHIVAGSGYHDGAYELVLLNKDGSLIRYLYKSNKFIRPVWSPDGEFIYGLNYSYAKSIRKWDSEGKKFTDVPVKGAESEYKYLQMISFSPSNKRAVLLLDNFNKMLLVSVYNDHFQAIKIILKDYSYVSQSVWLDDNNLLFVGKKDEPRGELWELNVDSEKVRKLGVPRLWLRDFVTLSPDGKAVIVCAMPDNEETKWNLWHYSFGSPHAKRITDGIEDVSPYWRH